MRRQIRSLGKFPASVLAIRAFGDVQPSAWLAAWVAAAALSGARPRTWPGTASE